MSRKRRKARQIGAQPLQKSVENVVQFERPAKPLVRYAVQLVPTELLRPLFPVLSPFVKLSTDKSGGRFTPEFCFALAERDEMQIWAVLANNEPCGALVTTTQLYPATGLHALQIVQAGGFGLVKARAEIRKAMLGFKAYRKCDVIEWMARSGFERLWPGCERLGIACEVR